MDAVLRRLKLRKGTPQDTEARKRLQHDLFAFDNVSRSCTDLWTPYEFFSVQLRNCVHVIIIISILFYFLIFSLIYFIVFVPLIVKILWVKDPGVIIHLVLS